MSFKLKPVRRREQSEPIRKSSLIEKIVGKANEVLLIIDGRPFISLLDTGSMVSTISATLSNSMDLTIQPLEHLLTVEGAGGHTLSYLGYVEVTISCLDIDMQNLSVIMLVVPDTKYHDRVTALLGTNILGLLTDKQSVWNAV